MPILGQPAGPLRHRLAVLYPQETGNTFGELAQLWQLQTIVWGRVDPKSAQKPWVAQQCDPQTTHLIEVRYLPGLNTKYQLVKAGSALTVIAHTVSAGSQVVTPASMAQIVPNGRLWVGSETDSPPDVDVVTVASVTSTQFTATFGTSHAAGVNVNLARTYKLLKVFEPEEVHHRMLIEAVEETSGTP